MQINEQILSDLPFTKRLYNETPYNNEAQAKVIHVDENQAIFDQTIFYGESGGQIYDTGLVVCNQNTEGNRVISVQHKNGKKPDKKD